MKLKNKSLIKHIKIAILYIIQHFYMKLVWHMKNWLFLYKDNPGWTWSMNDIWKMENISVAKHVHKVIEVIWKINSK